MELMERIAGIEPADQAAYAACQAQLNQIAKPLGVWENWKRFCAG